MKDNTELQDCVIMPMNSTYLSPDIQNELIGILTIQFRKKVVAVINSADVPSYSVAD